MLHYHNERPYAASKYSTSAQWIAVGVLPQFEEAPPPDPVRDIPLSFIDLGPEVPEAASAAGYRSPRVKLAAYWSTREFQPCSCFYPTCGTVGAAQRRGDVMMIVFTGRSKWQARPPRALVRVKLRRGVIV